MAKRVFIAVVSALALVAGAASSPAKESRLDEIEERIDANEKKIDEAREQSQDVRDQLEESETRRQDVAVEVRDLRTRLTDARERLATVRAELNTARERLQALTTELDAARDELEQQQATLDERAAAAYKIGPAAFAEVILGAQDIEALTDRISYMEALLTIDAEMVQQVRFARGVVDDRQGRVASYEANVADREGDVEDRTLHIAELEAEQSALLGQIDLEIGAQSDMLGNLQDARAKYEQAVAALELESAQIQGLIQGSGSAGAGNYGGTMVWPTSGPIVSGFGYRTHPIYGTTRFHSGVDIDGACNQAIYAGETGVVLSSGENGGYGLATVIDHGGGLSTLYAHQSSLGVSPGQRVARAEQIGNVGTTGLSTGCHLHFEVRINGQPVDPVPYLS